jgi:hypothetical protein
MPILPVDSDTTMILPAADLQAAAAAQALGAGPRGKDAGGRADPPTGGRTGPMTGASPLDILSAVAAAARGNTAPEVPKPSKPASVAVPAQPPLPTVALPDPLPFEPIEEGDFFDDDPGEVTAILPPDLQPPFPEPRSAPSTAAPPRRSSRDAPREPARSAPPPARTPVAAVGGPRAASPAGVGTTDEAFRELAAALGGDEPIEVSLNELEDGDDGDDEGEIVEGADPSSGPSAFARIAFGNDRAPGAGRTAADGAGPPRGRRADAYVIAGDNEETHMPGGGDTAPPSTARALRLTDEADYGHAPPPPTLAGPPRRTDADAVRVKQLLAEADNKANRGDIQGSIQAFTDALDIDPESAEAHLGRGRCFLDLGDYSSAMSDFQRAEDMLVGKPDPHVAMGDLYFARKEYKRAIEFYDHAIELDGSHAMARCKRGLSHYYRKNYRQAVQDLERALALDPEIPNIRKYLQMVNKRM